MQVQPKRVRSWLLTVNYKDSDADPLDTLNDAQFEIFGRENPGLAYAIGQFEVGETGRPHLQAFLRWEQPKSLGQCREWGGEGWHWEPVRGAKSDTRRCIDYCSKTSGRLEGPWQVGEAPDQGVRSDLSAVARAVLDGESDHKLAQLYPATFVQYGRGLRVLRAAVEQPRIQERKLYWIAGASGIGKSHRAWTQYPDAYPLATWKWWDGYSGQSAVIADDVCISDINCEEFLSIVDKWPRRLPVKGGFVGRDWVVIVFTSNVSWDVFKSTISAKPEQWDALDRRLTKAIWAETQEELEGFFDE